MRLLCVFFSLLELYSAWCRREDAYGVLFGISIAQDALAEPPGKPIHMRPILRPIVRPDLVGWHGQATDRLHLHFSVWWISLTRLRIFISSHDSHHQELTNRQFPAARRFSFRFEVSHRILCTSQEGPGIGR